MLVDEDARELVISAAPLLLAGLSAQDAAQIEDSLIGRVVREGRVIVIRDVLEEKQYRYPRTRAPEGSGVAALGALDDAPKR